MIFCSVGIMLLSSCLVDLNKPGESKSEEKKTPITQASPIKTTDHEGLGNLAVEITKSLSEENLGLLQIRFPQSADLEEIKRYSNLFTGLSDSELEAHLISFPTQAEKEFRIRFYTMLANGLRFGLNWKNTVLLRYNFSHEMNFGREDAKLTLILSDGNRQFSVKAECIKLSRAWIILPAIELTGIE